MEFVLLAAIFLTSTGFLVKAAVTPTPTAAVAPAMVPALAEGSAAPPQLSPQLPALNAPVRQQDTAMLTHMTSNKCISVPACGASSGSTQ